MFESQRRCDGRRIIGRGLPVHATVTENVGYNSNYDWLCEHCKAKFWYGKRLNKKEICQITLKGYSKTGIFGECRLCLAESDPPRFLQLYVYDTKNEVANRMRHFRGSGSDKCDDQDIPKFKIRLDSMVGARGYDFSSSLTLGSIVFEGGPWTRTNYDVNNESKDRCFDPKMKQRVTGDNNRLSINMAVTRPLYTIEFKKHGLPNCHTLLWVDPRDKILHAEDTDQYIYTKFQDLKLDLEGYRVSVSFKAREPLRSVVNDDWEKDDNAH
ncbi:hypothetical protein Tco_0931940 [Tanacetum coccineum]